MTPRRAARSAPGALALTLPLLSPGAAAAQGFGDFENIGRLEDARREPGALTVGGHSFEPSLNLELFGVTRPHVFAALGGGWTDNLLQEDREAPGGRRSELFGRGEAGLRLDTNLSDHLLVVEYRAAFTEQADSGEFDTFEQSASARLDLFFNEVSGHADLSYQRVAYAQSIQLRGVVRLDVYRAKLWTQARLGKFGVRIGGRAERFDYLESELDDLDHDAVGFDAQVYRRITPKLRGLVEYNLELIRFHEGDDGALNDFDVHSVLAGVDGELSPKLSVSLKAGYTVQVVDDDVTNDDRALQGFSARASADYQLAPRTTLTASYRRRIQVSFTSNGRISDSVRAGVKQSFYEERVTAEVRGGYTHSRVSPGEHLDVLTANASVGWQVRQWLSVRGAYDFRKLASAFPLSDYTVHTVTISAGVGF